MRKHQRNRRNSGFTLVEMITVVAIFGLILTLLGVEFVSVVDHTLHTRVNTDAESQARVIMSKVETHMRAAYWDYVDAPPGSPAPVVSPISGTTPAPFVVFYRVSAGGLVGTPTLCPSKYAIPGAPCPPFEQVTIQLDPLRPGVLEEIVAPMTLAGPGPAEPPIVLGNNVTSFGVTPPSASSTNRYDLALTVTIGPNSHCVNNLCSFTLNDSVYVGGQE